ncbi:ATP-grasp fold amidoligase family protein [Providencia hangzhouensis]|uniref:ATP-grasp fold amidoligase family protein n=1 Tax=Providencia hangzhouensis TaxID=3031799 RepID=UPI0034DD0A27
MGEQYLIPLISSHNDTSSINFELLPPKFVIKTNFGSGDEHIEIVKNKKEISQSGIISKFNKAMNSSYKGTILGENQYESIEKKSSLKSLLKINSEILMTSNSMYLTLKMVFYNRF